MTTRRGFTLIELLIGLVLMLAVGAVAYQLLVNTQRVSRSQGEHIGMQDNVRSGALIIANELREVGYDQITAAELVSLQTRYGAGTTFAAGVTPDLIAIGPDSITYRAMRGLGYTCNLLPGSSDVVVINKDDDPRKWQSLRTLTATDSLLLYVENDPSTSSDDLWFPVGLQAAPVAQNCPDGTAGLRFRVAYPAGFTPNITALFNATNMPLGGPVRAFEVMQMCAYVSSGKAWLGMRSRPSAGTSIEPVLGPLRNSDKGLALTFRDATNTPTAVRNNVRSIEVSLQSVSDGLVRTTGKYAGVDSTTITTRVALRNALRP